MTRRFIFILICVAISQFCKGQGNASKEDTTGHVEFFNNEFRWEISIPKGFDTMSTKLYLALRDLGIKDLEKSAHENFESDTVATRICAYQSDGIFNYFEANQEVFDPKIDGDFFTHCRQNDDYIYAAYKKVLFSDIKIDTTITDEMIDAYSFRRFQLRIDFSSSREMNMYVYSRLFGKKEFTFVIVCLSKKKLELILNAWENSKFKRI
jgi:hypothetical protein